MKRNGRWMIAAAAPVVAAALTAAACGSGSAAKSASSPSPSASDTVAAGAARGGRGNRTPPPAVQTSIAQGTPAGFNRTPSTAQQTSIAEGTPAGFGGFGNRTPGANETAIAQGTPASALRGPGGGGGGGGRNITLVAAALALDEAQLRSELPAQGATIASVAAAHGFDRGRIKQALIDATKQRLSDAVASGGISQDMADQNQSQFSANIDVLLDAPGGAAGG